MGKRTPREGDRRRKTDQPRKKAKADVSMCNPGLDTVRATKVLPAVQALSSVSPTERAAAIAAVDSLLKDDSCRLPLLKERVVQRILEETLHDSTQEVVVRSWCALRTVAEKEGYDHCIHMFRKGIVSPLSAAIAKLSSAIESVASNPSALDNDTKSLLWPFTDSVVGLIVCLSETNQDVLSAITEMNVAPFLMRLLDPATGAPEDVQTTVARCLQSLTEENDDFVRSLVENEGYVSRLLQMKDAFNAAWCVKGTAICGVLHNISLVLGQAEQGISDAAVLPVLTEFMKSIVSMDLHPYAAGHASKEDMERIRAGCIALETLASIATSLSCELEGVTNVARDDTDLDTMEEDMENDGTAAHEILSDIEALSFSDSAESAMRYLMDTTAPMLIHLSQPQSISLKDLQLRSLGALNNIAWTVYAAVPSNTSLGKRWGKLSNDIWTSVVSPILAASEADTELAEAVAGVAWAVAKTAKGQLDVSNGQYRAFIGLYQAASTDDLRTKCIGVLGSLALAQGRIEVNMEIGSFLVSLVSGIPDGPIEPIVEALNVLFDVYADKDFDYDEPVFVKNGFLAHLQASLPKYRKMIRKVDRLKFPEQRLRADEAGLNLQRFIAYKQKEPSIYYI